MEERGRGAVEEEWVVREIFSFVDYCVYYISIYTFSLKLHDIVRKITNLEVH